MLVPARRLRPAPHAARGEPARWWLLVAACAMALLMAAGCVRPRERHEPIPPREVPWPERSVYEAEAWHLLDSLARRLDLLDSYLAFRMGTPSCAAPTPEAWHAASMELRDVNAAAEALHQQVATSSVDPALWRERRALAAATRALVEASQAALWVRLEIDLVGPDGNGGRAVQPLQRTREQYREAAALLGVGAGNAPGDAACATSYGTRAG